MVFRFKVCLENNLKAYENTLLYWFGLGQLPKAPGTWGTLGAIPLVILTHFLGPWLDLLTSFFFVFFAIALCQKFEAQSGQHDPGEIVIDEVCGFLIAMVWIPLTPLSLVLGFLIFRVFDIFKPFPISWLDRNVKGGFGVVIDDVAAGLLTNLILQYVHTQWNFFGPVFIPF